MGDGFGFEVAADDGFGSAGSEGDPFVIGKEEFVAIGGDEFFDGRIADFFETFGEAF